MKKKESKKPMPFKVLQGALLTGTLLVLMESLIGCVGFGKPVIHSLEQDFRLVNPGQTITVEKSGALVSDYWLEYVAGVEVEK